MTNFMKNNQFDKQIKIGLQKQAELFQSATDTDIEFEKIMQGLQQKKMEETKMKRFNMKKAVIATAAAVMLLGTLTVASGGAKFIESHSSAIPDYTKYADLATAENRAGVTTNAPESFSNGYRFSGITIVERSYENEEHNAIDSFQSISIRYKNGSDDIMYDVDPRPILSWYAEDAIDTIEKNGITYYYNEVHSKWVPGNYQPTDEEKAQVEAGTLNIGYGADKISYSDSKSITWEKNGNQYQLFCMDVDISKEALLGMALEIQ